MPATIRRALRVAALVALGTIPQTAYAAKTQTPPPNCADTFTVTNSGTHVVSAINAGPAPTVSLSATTRPGTFQDVAWGPDLLRAHPLHPGQSVHPFVVFYGAHPTYKSRNYQLYIQYTDLKLVQQTVDICRDMLVLHY